MTRLNRIVGVIFVIVISLSLATAATAQRRGAPTTDPDSRNGVAMVSKVDARLGRITIDEEVYRVDDQTSIKDWNGQTVALSSIRAPQRRRGQLIPMNEIDYVRYEAIRRRGQWRMVSMVVLEEPAL